MSDALDQTGDSAELVTTDDLDDDERIDALLDTIPEEKLAEYLCRHVVEEDPSIIAQVTSWRAPLPPAEMMRQYEEISPGFADRIMTSAEKEQDHRHDCDKIAIGASIQANNRGQWMGFSIAILMIIFTGALIWSGQKVMSTVFAGVTLLGLVSLFTTGRLWPFGSKDNSDNDEHDDTEIEELDP